MEIIAIVFIQIVMAILTAITRAVRANRISEANSSLCNTCFHAHVASGFGRRTLTRCTYAWASREMNFAVSDCTMYFSRPAATRLVRIAGFAAREPVSAEAAARNQ
jgi:hypothetical protein